MNPILRLLSSGVADATSLARMVAETGLRSVSEVFSGTSIYGSLTAATNAEVIHDETHYLLVPLLGKQSQFAVYSKRVLPPGIGTMNSLPKARIFHLPDDSGKGVLEDQLIQSMIQQRAGTEAGSSDLADSLELIAEKIDEETGKISGGLILIGGAVAFVNPLLGAGIIVKGLLPSIGSMASKAGAAYVGKKLRDWNQSTAETKVRKDATKEVQKLKPTIYVNPILRSLEIIASNPEVDYDPSLDQRNWVDHFETFQYYQSTLEAIQEVYKDFRPALECSNYQASHVQWIESLLDARAK